MRQHVQSIHHVQSILAKADADEALFESAGSLAQETSLAVTGTVKVDERAPGGVELRITAIEVGLQHGALIGGEG